LVDAEVSVFAEDRLVFGGNPVEVLADADGVVAVAARGLGAVEGAVKLLAAAGGFGPEVHAVGGDGKHEGVVVEVIVGGIAKDVDALGGEELLDVGLKGDGLDLVLHDRGVAELDGDAGGVGLELE
jgi:hypothetical protein